MIFETRLHGRGGQGVVTAAELLSVAAFTDGLYAQAFPSFGSERTGAPVVSFCRISDREIRNREPISEPDAIAIIDPTLLHQLDVFSGVKPGAYAVINSSRPFSELNLEAETSELDKDRIRTVPATDLAREHLGRPLPNIALLGALAGLTGVVTLSSLEAAIGERFPAKLAAGNIAAAAAAYEIAAPSSGKAPVQEVVDA